MHDFLDLKRKYGNGDTREGRKIRRQMLLDQQIARIDGEQASVERELAAALLLDPLEREFNHIMKMFVVISKQRAEEEEQRLGHFQVLSKEELSNS